MRRMCTENRGQTPIPQTESISVPAFPDNRIETGVSVMSLKNTPKTTGESQVINYKPVSDFETRKNVRQSRRNAE